MPRRFRHLLALSAAAGLMVAGAGVASANPPDGSKPPPDRNAPAPAVADELPNPAAEKQRALQSKALQLVLTGQKKIQTINGVKVVKMGKKPARLSAAERARVRAGRTVQPRMVDAYVPLSRTQTDKIFVLLTEFGNTRATDIDPQYGDQDTDPDTPGPATFDGPLHNKIPAPDRTKDNSTIWQADYSAAHYRRLYFGTGRGVESLKTYYQRQSSGRYSVDGVVTDWVKVPYNEARYGRSDGFPCASNVCSNTWALLTDGLQQWVADQKAAGRTDAQIKAAVASYDQQDRNDYDGDGNFAEPDGYIDHFQIVHAGGDQADGDPYQGEDAIWSHRWKAYQNLIGSQGPAGNLDGGVQIGNTGIWAADYTIQPENGGLSVFAHEYGHDLGLPDHYDTAGGGDNAVNWWTLMAQSRVRGANDVGIGTRPADLGVWDKLFLGWLDYEVAVAGQQKTFQFGPHEYNSAKAQALAVVLPKKTVVTDVPDPASGTKQWWSGSADDYTATLTRSVAVPSGSSQLTFKANYDIEAGYDFAVVEVDDGSGWKSVSTNLSTAEAVFANGIDGSSKGAYVDGTADMSGYAGKTVSLRFRYTTDGGVAGNDDDPSNNGFFVDDIALGTVFSDGAEDGANGWTATGFSIIGGTVSNDYDNFYLASNRTYTSYDRYLRTGPYNFSFGPALPDKVEFFPYQTGLLVNYWDTSFTDNNESQHPGQGLILPIDSHPDLIYNLEGRPWRGRIQTYDAPFSLQKADSFYLTLNGRRNYIRGQAAQPLFDDTRSYWRAELPNVGVKTPGVGVTLRVTRQENTSMTVRLGTSRTVSPAATMASARSKS